MVVFYVLVLVSSLSLVQTCHPGAGYNGINNDHTGMPPQDAEDDSIFVTSMVTAIVTETESTADNAKEVNTKPVTHHLLSTIVEADGHMIDDLHQGQVDLHQPVPHQEFLQQPVSHQKFLQQSVSHQEFLQQPVSHQEFMLSVREETSHDEMENVASEPCEHRQCPPRHLQDRFCRSDFVMQARVVPKNLTKVNTTHLSYLNDAQADIHQTWSTENISATYDQKLHTDEERTILLTSQTSRHHLVLQRILKGSHHWFQCHMMVEIAFDETSAKCHGRQVEENASYILMGGVIEGRLFLAQCDWPLPVHSLTGNQRHGLKHQYGRYCQHCQVDTQILPPDPWSTSTYSHVCVYNPTLYNEWGQEDCEGDYSICAKTNTGTCHWLKTSGQMRACVERRDHQGAMPPAPVWVVPDPN